MRRANYATSASNEQFCIVGDHLGCTTLVVDAAPPPKVVQRQYYKPYGETAWQYEVTSTGGESLTNVGYTGQKTDEDSTGLMFYLELSRTPDVNIWPILPNAQDLIKVLEDIPGSTSQWNKEKVISYEVVESVDDVHDFYTRDGCTWLVVQR